MVVGRKKKTNRNIAHEGEADSKLASRKEKDMVRAQAKNLKE